MAVAISFGCTDDNSEIYIYRQIDASDWNEKDASKFFKWYEYASNKDVLKVIAYLDFVDNDIWDAIKYAKHKICVTHYTDIADYVTHAFTNEVEADENDIPLWLTNSIDYQKAWDELQANPDDYIYTPYQIEDNGVIVEVYADGYEDQNWNVD